MVYAMRIVHLPSCVRHVYMALVTNNCCINKHYWEFIQGNVNI